MPKLITLVEDEFTALKNGALHLIAEAKELVEKLTEHGHPEPAKPASLAAAASKLEAHIANPATLLAVPDLSPKPVVVITPPTPETVSSPSPVPAVPVAGDVPNATPTATVSV